MPTAETGDSPRKKVEIENTLEQLRGLCPSDATDCSRCVESRKLADDAMATLREIKDKYGFGDRHVMREKNQELTEAWHLLNVLPANMMDDGPTWPRVLEWLRRNEQFRPENAATHAPGANEKPLK